MRRIDDPFTASGDNDYDTMLDIICQRIESNQTLQSMMPSDRSLVIHLRTGDVIDRLNVSIRDYLLYDSATGKDLGRWYTRGLLFYANVWKEIQRENIQIDNIMVVTGFHKNDDHSRSIVYINRVIRYLEKLVDTVTVRINENPDEDLIIMANSKHFVASGGGFTRAITALVTKNGGRVFGYIYDDKHNCMVFYDEQNLWRRITDYFQH